MVTAFTIGHSVTLALATLNIIQVSVPLVEALIVFTILFTAVSNLFTSDEQRTGITVNFWYAAFFGLIHGLGFSNMLRTLLMGSDSLALPLFAFNTGLEAGQVVVLALFSGLTYLAADRLRISRRDWKLVISSAIAGMSLMLLADRVGTLFEL